MATKQAEIHRMECAKCGEAASGPDKDSVSEAMKRHAKKHSKKRSK